MIWQDLLLEHRYTPAQLRPAVAAAFGVRAEDTHLIASLEELPANYAVAAVARTTSGDFRTALSLFVDEPFVPKERLPVIRALCTVLHTRVLVSDDSPDPYTMILVDASGSARAIGLDPEALDEREEYRLQEAALPNA